MVAYFLHDDYHIKSILAPSVLLHYLCGLDVVGVKVKTSSMPRLMTGTTATRFRAMPPPPPPAAAQSTNSSFVGFLSDFSL